jgi:hypothetical protein
LWGAVWWRKSQDRKAGPRDDPKSIAASARLLNSKLRKLHIWVHSALGTMQKGPRWASVVVIFFHQFAFSIIHKCWYGIIKSSRC